MLWIAPDAKAEKASFRSTHERQNEVGERGVRPMRFRRQDFYSPVPMSPRPTINWSNTYARSGLVCLPVIGAWLLVGVVALGHTWAVHAVAGAVTVGFAAFQRFGQRQTLPMLGTLVGIALATWLGSVAGYFGAGCLILVATAFALAFGAATTLGYATWWVGLQVMIGLLVFGARSEPPLPALGFAASVLLGGVTQLIVLRAVRPFTQSWFGFQTQRPIDEDDEALLRRFIRNANPLVSRYAARVAIAVALGVCIDRFWGIHNGYWIPMTAAILLKPDPRETWTRSLNRITGTVAGAALTTLAVSWLRPDPWQLAAPLLLAIWACYALMRVHYALFATAITTYVVLLLAMIGLPEFEVAWHRALATLIGATLAMLVHVIPLPSVPPSHVARGPLVPPGKVQEPAT